MKSGFWIFAILILQIISVSGDDKYTEEELEKLPKLLAAVEKNLTQEYMFDSGYLVRFLRAKHLDLDAAEAMLLKNLAWRKKTNLEGILSEDFAYFEKRFPFYLTTDREGRAAEITGLRQLDFRKMVLNNKADKVMRYIFYVLERGLEAIHRNNNETGLNFIDGSLLFNFAGYNTRTYACSQCVPYWLELAKIYENYYPLQGHSIIIINAPRIFETLLNSTVKKLSIFNIDAIRIFGYDKSFWLPEILKIYPPENLTPEFGGTMKLDKH